MILTVEFGQDGERWCCRVTGFPGGGSVASYRCTKDEAVRHAVSDALHLLAADLRQGAIPEPHGGIEFVYVHGSFSVP